MPETSLDTLLKAEIKKTTILEPVVDSKAIPVCCHSKFGGTPYAEAGDSWPICTGCNQELTFVSQIRHEAGNQLAVFYYCFHCLPWGLDDELSGQWLIRLYEKPTLENTVDIAPRSIDEFSPVPSKVVSIPVDCLPDWETISATHEDVDELCHSIDEDCPWEVYENAVDRAGCLIDYSTRLGGYPAYLQSADQRHCPTCDATMEFYAQIASEEFAGITWGDSGMVYLFRCAEHANEFQLALHSQ